MKPNPKIPPQPVSATGEKDEKPKANKPGVLKLSHVPKVKITGPGAKVGGVVALLLAMMLSVFAQPGIITQPGTQASVFTNRLLTTLQASGVTNRLTFTNASAAFGATNATHIKSNSTAGRWEWLTNYTSVVATNVNNSSTGVWTRVLAGAATYGQTRYEPRSPQTLPDAPSSTAANPVFVQVNSNGVVTSPTNFWEANAGSIEASGVDAPTVAAIMETNNAATAASATNLYPSAPLSVNFLGGTLTSGNATLGASGVAVAGGGALTPSGFVGQGLGVTNVSGVATGATNAAGAVLATIPDVSSVAASNTIYQMTNGANNLSVGTLTATNFTGNWAGLTNVNAQRDNLGRAFVQPSGTLGNTNVPWLILDIPCGVDYDVVAQTTWAIHAHRKGLIELKAVTTPYRTAGSVTNSARALDAIFQNAGLQIPIGLNSGGEGPGDNDYFATYIATNWPNAGDAGHSYPAAEKLWREILTASATNNTIIMVPGPAWNIRNFFNTTADSISPLTGAELDRSKVKFWIGGAGNWPTPTNSPYSRPEYNFSDYTASAYPGWLALTNRPVFWAGSDMIHSISNYVWGKFYNGQQFSPNSLVKKAGLFYQKGPAGVGVDIFNREWQFDIATYLVDTNFAHLINGTTGTIFVSITGGGPPSWTGWGAPYVTNHFETNPAGNHVFMRFNTNYITQITNLFRQTVDRPYGEYTAAFDGGGANIPVDTNYAAIATSGRNLTNGIGYDGTGFWVKGQTNSPLPFHILNRETGWGLFGLFPSWFVSTATNGGDPTIYGTNVDLRIKYLECMDGASWALSSNPSFPGLNFATGVPMRWRTGSTWYSTKAFDLLNNARGAEFTGALTVGNQSGTTADSGELNISTNGTPPTSAITTGALSINNLAGQLFIFQSPVTSGTWDRTNHFPFLTGSNFVAVATNFVPALWTVPRGSIRIMASNMTLYSVSESSTNALW